MSDDLIFNKWETGNFILSIWTRADGVVMEVEVRLRPSSPFQGRCRCGAVTSRNLAAAVLADEEMVMAEEAAPPALSGTLPEWVHSERVWKSPLL